MKKLSQNFSNLNKDLKIQRNDKMETKNVTVEMKKSLQGINSKSVDTGEYGHFFKTKRFSLPT